MTAARYFLTRPNNNQATTREILVECMSHYDPRDYRPDPITGTYYALAMEEWENAWEPNNVDVFTTREDAEAAQERAENFRTTVVEVTPAAILDALENLFLTAYSHTDATMVAVVDATGREVIEIPVGIISDDPQAWEEEADARLLRAGFERAGPWEKRASAPLWAGAAAPVRRRA